MRIFVGGGEALKWLAGTAIVGVIYSKFHKGINKAAGSFVGEVAKEASASFAQGTDRIFGVGQEKDKWTDEDKRNHPREYAEWRARQGQKTQTSSQTLNEEFEEFRRWKENQKNGKEGGAVGKP